MVAVWTSAVCDGAELRSARASGLESALGSTPDAHFEELNGTGAVTNGADQGNEDVHVDAQNNLGSMYRRGEGVVEDLAEAARLYRFAADQGNADAQCHLGMMYKKGTGVERDLVEAVRLLQLAADQGDADAQYHLGVIYRMGEGVAEDLAEAARLLWLAADQGSVYAVYANSILANMYANGMGVTEDLAEAARLYRLVAATAADIDEGNERVHLDGLHEDGLHARPGDAQNNLERLNRKLGHRNGIPMSDVARPEDSVQAGNLASGPTVRATASGGKPDGTVEPPRKPTAWNYFLQVRAIHALGCPVISCSRAVHFARRLGLAGHSRVAQVFRRVSAQRFGHADLLPSRFHGSDAGLSFGDIANEAATRWRALSKQTKKNGALSHSLCQLWWAR